MKNHIKTQMQEKFIQACYNNDLDAMKKLFEPPFNILIDLAAQARQIQTVYESGYFKLGDFLLTLPQLSAYYASSIVNQTFLSACINGNESLVKMFFEDKKYAQYINEDNLISAFGGAYRGDKRNILAFLINEANIDEHHPKIKEWMKPNFLDKSELNAFCQTLFMQKALSESLPEKSVSRLKSKI